MSLATPPIPIRPPSGAAPSWAANARGAYLWDAHGRRHLDLGGAGGAVLLGHADPVVEAAVATAAPDAASRAAAHLRAMLPPSTDVRLTADAEAARAAALALAVRATDRTAIVSVANPDDIGGLATRLARGDVAAVWLDPDAAPGALIHVVRALSLAAGTLLILDENRAGFRRDLGGRARASGLRADLTLWDASLANGRSIGALSGDAALLAHMPAGAAVSDASAAAVSATLSVLEREPVAQHLAVRGAEIQAELERVIVKTGAGAFIAVGGDPAWITLEIHHPDAKRIDRRLTAQLAARGVHAPGPLAVSYRHDDSEVEMLIDAFAEALQMLVETTLAQPIAA